MRYRITFLTMAVLLVVAVSGCDTGKSEPRNMEQIYAEEGVPVRVETIEPTEFSVNIEFRAGLSGIEESSAFAAIDDKVDRIHVPVGDFVNKDDVIISFPTDNPSARYYQAKVSFENSEASFKRMENLYASGGISLQALDNARTAYRVAQADWESVQQSVEVQAPISGILSKINVRKSDNVHEDDELFTISQVDRLKATIWVSDGQISDIKVGAKATASWNGLVLQGSVVQVDMSMDQSRQAFGVVVEFENPDMLIKGGVTGIIRVECYSRPDAIVVKRKDVNRDASGLFVFVAEADVAVRRPVSLGRTSGIDTEVVSGLSVGDLLITEGQMHLDDGKKIKIIEAGAATAANLRSN